MEFWNNNFEMVYTFQKVATTKFETSLKEMLAVFMILNPNLIKLLKKKIE